MIADKIKFLIQSKIKLNWLSCKLKTKATGHIQMERHYSYKQQLYEEKLREFIKKYKHTYFFMNSYKGAIYEYR